MSIERDYPFHTVRRPEKEHWVYIITAAEHNWQKIGISSRPDGRLRELGVLLPFSIQLLTTVRVQGKGISKARAIEKFTYEKFAARRIRKSEWFCGVSMREFLEAVVEAQR